MTAATQRTAGGSGRAWNGSLPNASETPLRALGGADRVKLSKIAPSVAQAKGDA